ncbi:unnamed protein product, partial [Didymodactylos carnosus]
LEECEDNNDDNDKKEETCKREDESLGLIFIFVIKNGSSGPVRMTTFPPQIDDEGMQ